MVRERVQESIGNDRAKAISENEPNYEPDCESDCDVRHHIAIHRPDRTSPAIIVKQEPLRRDVIVWRVSSRLPSPALSHHSPRADRSALRLSKTMHSLLSIRRITYPKNAGRCPKNTNQTNHSKLVMLRTRHDRQPPPARRKGYCDPY